MGTHYGAGGAEVSDTPETDGEWNRIACYEHPQFEQGIADFARKLERERDVAREVAKNLSVALTAAIRSANVRQEEAEKAIAQRDEAFRACQIWQQGHSKIVEDRDYWKAEAERWRDLSYNTEEHQS